VKVNITKATYWDSIMLFMHDEACKMAKERGDNMPVLGQKIVFFQ
jgi:hypothetical protein